MDKYEPDYGTKAYLLIFVFYSLISYRREMEALL